MEVEVTHPFHPWKGRRLVLATRKQNWGEDRVMFFDAHGQLRSLPAAWTDVDPPDARTDAAAGRSFFRADDLSTLVALVGEIKSRHHSRRKRVK
ncbi:hypothetical protein C7T35_40075 [Variovorax sp. WS11]|uniref:DUF5372 family protein n=1 Tax=Variovorax sp. WS11 TaxID=1105204 RepID=UPI000D0DEB81|nr:DUF5372 family protein [Variovorax sp. WS11]NDZ15791.1 hypothetical protein [Variovorax sp. WS11]NDZ16136.1 hypothetical protein [Variovorax sp. WS11]NDZ17162.1 hypothetical protein [Variovorax sp. WS11]NDZ17671.1 hypothetical protein [Variovorax sp. WS11]PSL78972.1 hypothetical protein C7T35_40075 [Variovorax sp. WS11]